MKTAGHIALVLLLWLITSMASPPVEADEYPTSPIKIVVPFPPGGATDMMARLLASHLQTTWNQPVVVENRPGAGGMIGSALVARSKSDGYTLLLGAPNLSTARATIKNLSIDPFKDLVGISQLLESPNVIVVNGKLPVQTLQDFVNYAKARPGQLNYGVFTTSGRLTFALFRRFTGVDLVPVSYSGEATMISAIVGGEVQLGIGSSTAVQGLIGQGINVLAVASDHRLASMPNVPTTIEAGFGGFQRSIWYGILAPTGTPDGVRQKLANEIANFSKRPDIIKKMATLGFVLKTSAPDVFTDFLVKDEFQWVALGKEIGLEPE